MLNLEMSEEYSSFLEKKTVLPLFKERFDMISVPVKEWGDIFSSQRKLADSTWASLSWKERLFLKESFLAKELFRKFYGVCPL